MIHGPDLEQCVVPSGLAFPRLEEHFVRPLSFSPGPSNVDKQWLGGIFRHANQQFSIIPFAWRSTGWCVGVGEGWEVEFSGSVLYFDRRRGWNFTRFWRKMRRPMENRSFIRGFFFFFFYRVSVAGRVHPERFIALIFFPRHWNAPMKRK